MVIWVRDVWLSLEVLTAEEVTTVSVAEPSEFVGVNVDVENTVDSSCDDDEGVTMTEDVSSVNDGCVVSEVAVVTVVDGSSVVTEVVFEACRLNNAIASSKGSAAAKDARKLAKTQKKMD